MVCCRGHSFSGVNRLIRQHLLLKMSDDQEFLRLIRSDLGFPLAAIEPLRLGFACTIFKTPPEGGRIRADVLIRRTTSRHVPETKMPRGNRGIFSFSAWRRPDAYGDQ